MMLFEKYQNTGAGMTGGDGEIDTPFHLGGAEGKWTASPQLEFPVGMGGMYIYALDSLHTSSLHS
jgi:hypothetical protein